MRRHCRERSHRYDRVTHEARFGLPDGLEAALLRVLRVCHAFAYVMFVLQVHCYACHRVSLSVDYVRQLDDLDVFFATACILLPLDFAETDWAVFNMGLLRRQRHDYRDTPIASRNGDRQLMKHGVYEGCHLRDKALGITLYEEAVW